MDPSIEDIKFSSQFSSSPMDLDPNDDPNVQDTEEEFMHNEDMLLGADLEEDLKSDEKGEEKKKADGEGEGKAEFQNGDNEMDEGDNYEDVEDVEPALIDVSAHFTTDEVFQTLAEAESWIRVKGTEIGIAIKKVRSDFTSGRNAYVKFGCDRSGEPGSHAKGGIYHKKVGGEGKSKARKTSTNNTRCPFLVRCKHDKDNDIWRVDVGKDKGCHNHKLFLYGYGHSVLGRLTSDERELVKGFAKSGVAPRQIHSMLKARNPESFFIRKGIYNVIAKAKREERQGRSIIQEVFNLAEESKCLIRHTREDGELTNLFWSHSDSIKLARMFPHVFMIDCTYKTNKYKMALLQMVGVSSTDNSFSAAFALISAEREANFTWALKMLQEVLEGSSPSSIVTDKEGALMNAVSKVFPNASPMLCRWHIEKNVESHAKLKAQKNDKKKVMGKWEELQNSMTEEEFNHHWDDCKKLFTQKSIVYLEGTWVKKFKSKFVSAWTDRYFHLANRCTSRVEGVHAVLKKWLGSSNITLVTHWNSVKAMVEDQIITIKTNVELSLTRTPMHLLGKDWCRHLVGSVSTRAIEIIEKEYDRIETIGISADDCGCTIRVTHGLPCVHEIKRLLSTQRSIPLSCVHVFWRTLTLEAPSQPHGDELDYRPLVEQYVRKFERSSKDEQNELFERLREVIEPRTTTLREPSIKINPKGRPKGSKNKATPKSTQDDCSTKRDPSLFEHISQMEAKELSQALSQAFSSTLKEDKNETKVKIEPMEPCPKGANKLDYWLVKFPPIFQPYLEDVTNVDGDGNCGYRSIAVCLGRSEKKWPRIRIEILAELNDNPALYKAIFRDDTFIEKLKTTIPWKKGRCTAKRWMGVPTTLWMAANLYNVAISFVSTTMNLTIFPCTKGPPKEDPKLIWIAFVDGNHYVVPKMKEGCPMPVVSAPWETVSTTEAKEWEMLYHARLEEGERLFFPNGRPWLGDQPIE